MLRPKVIIADDHAMIRAALRKLLEPSCDVVADVGNGLALLEVARRLKPEIILIDIAMPLLNGLDAGHKLKRSMPNTKLIFLTVNEDPDVARKAFRIGASGYVSKHSVASELLQAIRYALCGKSYLTPLISKDPAEVFRGKVRKQDGDDLPTVRQKQVLQLLAEGYSMKKAAALLRITPRTVAFHKYRMMEECGLKTNVDLYQFAVKLGLLVGFSPH